VLEKTVEKQQNHPALITAALLHDIGKTRARFTLWSAFCRCWSKNFCRINLKFGQTARPKVGDNRCSERQTSRMGCGHGSGSREHPL